MQKTKTVRAHKRKTATGKTVTVKQHTAKYDVAAEARKAFLADSRAGSELQSLRERPTHGISADDYKEWYHWDTEDDPNNPAALRVKESLIRKMGPEGYRAYEEKMTNSYSKKGHEKGFLGLTKELKPKPNPTWEHTTKLPRKHSAERPLDNRGAANLAGITSSGLKMPKGFRYCDEGQSDDYDSFVATDKRAIGALKRQIAAKRWKSHENDGTTHFYSPDKTIHVVVNNDRASVFYRASAKEVFAPKPKALKPSQIPVSYRVTAKSLPKKNPAGTTVKMSATKRNGLFKYLPMQGWTLTDTVKSDSTTYGLFRKGDRSIAINTGKDKFYDEVVIQ